MVIDLHLHSYYSSDGVYPIPDLLKFFDKGDIVGIADHETIGGWKEFCTETRKRDLNPVLGIEWFSAGCHILSYFNDNVPQDFIKFMTERRNKERNSMILVYDKIKKFYPNLPSYDEILNSRPHPEKVLGLPALAEVVSELVGILLIDAEDMVRKEKRRIPVDIRPTPFSSEEIIRKINEWEAVPILAHPYRISGGRGRRKKADVEKEIKELESSGLRGVEVFSGSSNVEELRHLLSICHKQNLIPVIGSDFHYPGKGADPRKLGNLDPEIFKDMKEEIINWISKS